jgi:hypothetical protein
VRLLVHAGKRIARRSDIGRGDELEQLQRREVGVGRVNLIVVCGPFGERLLEDRWIRRHPGQRVVANASL